MTIDSTIASVSGHEQRRTADVRLERRFGQTDGQRFVGATHGGMFLAAARDPQAAIHARIAGEELYHFQRNPQVMRILRPHVLMIASVLSGLLLTNALMGQQKNTAAKAGTRQEIAVLTTGLGTIEIELYRKDAPKTTHNFVALANKGYFNGVKVHRISKDFVIQTGDPTGTGEGGQSIYGKPFEDEITKNARFLKKRFRKPVGGGEAWYGYPRGAVAMANLGRPSTNTSQFFILLKDADMPPRYTIFGQVITGMDVIDKIAASEIFPVMGPTDGKPKKDIVIKNIIIRTQ